MNTSAPQSTTEPKQGTVLQTRHLDAYGAISSPRCLHTRQPLFPWLSGPRMSADHPHESASVDEVALLSKKKKLKTLIQQLPQSRQGSSPRRTFRGRRKTAKKEKRVQQDANSHRLLAEKENCWTTEVQLGNAGAIAAVPSTCSTVAEC